MTTHIFLGPSLPLEEARQILDAEYHPPVRVGDVCDLLVDRPPPAVIGIVDGLFEQTPTVWHKEILFALSLGVRVFGSSSMGAIRAAELYPFGMVGIGDVFERFRSGELEDDDEVAVAHASTEYGSQSLSDAMVSLRYGIESAIRQGVIGLCTGQELIAGAKALFYPDRCWAVLQEIGRQRGLPPGELGALAEFVREHAPDVKRRDAIALLTHVARLPAGLQPDPPDFAFEPTFNWTKLVEIVRCRRSSDELGRRLGLSAPDAYAAVSESLPDVVRRALLDYLMRREVRRLGLTEPVSGQELRDDAICEALMQHYRHQLPEHLLAQLEPDELTDAVHAWQARQHEAAKPVPPQVVPPVHRKE